MWGSWSAYFAKRFAVHRRDDNVAWLSVDGAVDYHDVARVYASADHTIPFYYAHEVDIRGPPVDHFIERNALLELVGSRQRKTCREMERKKWELLSAGVERAEDRDHDENAYTVYSYN